MKRLPVAISSLLLVGLLCFPMGCSESETPGPGDDIAAEPPSGDVIQLLQALEALASTIETTIGNSNDQDLQTAWQAMSAVREDPSVTSLISVIRHDLTSAKLSAVPRWVIEVYLDSFEPLLGDADYKNTEKYQDLAVQQAVNAVADIMNRLESVTDKSGGETQSLGSTWCCYVPCPQSGVWCWQWHTVGAWAASKCVSLAVWHLAPSSWTSKSSCDTSSCILQN